MIWKLSPPNTNDRNLKLVSIFGYLEPDDNIITRNSSCMDLSCSKGLPLKWTCTDIDNQTCTLAEEIPSTNITWLWAVMVLISAPYLYAFITTFSRYCTKFSHKINIKILVVGAIRDLFHSAALCLLVFFVLPTMAPDMAAMTVFLVTCIPAVLNLNLRRFLPHMKIIVDNRKALKEEQKVSVPKSRSEFFYALIPVVLFFLSLIFFAVVVGRSSYANIYLVLEIILSCVFVSVEWFENFIIFNKTNVVSITNKSGKKAYLYSEKRDKILKGGVQPFRWVYLFAACSKEREVCVLALLKLVSLNVIFFPFIIGVITDWKVVWDSFLFEPNVNASLPSYIHSKMNLVSSDQISFGCNSSTPFVVMIICACSTFVFFKLAQHACRIMYQKSEFVIPIFLNLIITPFVIAVVQLNNQLFIVDGCSVLQPLWKTTFDWEYLDPWLLRISGIIGSISVFLLIRKLLWRKTDIPLQQVTKLFSKTTYCGLYPDVSLLLSRKADEKLTYVMYMHYLLTRRFGPRKVDEVLANLESTFILALDGDVDFQPEAVSFLLQGIKKNERVGACCGRIHPIGSGPMVWYQKFEYAASHWLQKATEHVCGCVLCSPGCFTLMRGSALLDNNVLRKYSTEPKTPWQMVQFDQGEDRWLCTLLLTQGHRIEYCAASDAKTFAPEGFMEFFKQRRRWSPSTIANIIDILSKFSYCAKKNDSISKLYLAYQAFLLCTAIITPASILLLMIGATVIAFSLEPWLAMILVILPTLFFTISIFASEEETQLFLASIISGLYAIAMVVVLIGIFKAGIEAGFCSETTILICFVGGIFVVAAILHPREWTCILPGLLYFFAVPAVSVILMIYAIGNIHVTSWGTRELTVDKKQKGREVACGFGDVCRYVIRE
ncbi:hypothetical protein FSP39_009557 [Pinctada imbricata]|uniref:chitin synthase n=1 Tax=Pinctada imbricata TaxID=66713 RepID=A0AA88XVQ9_PINIB|nr:hypothetical protein FSP39_009557 [Pinctada imbricata]